MLIKSAAYLLCLVFSPSKILATRQILPELFFFSFQVIKQENNLVLLNSYYWSSRVAIEQICGKYNVIFCSVVSFVFCENLEMIILGAHTWTEMQVGEDIAGELALTFNTKEIKRNISAVPRN
jgi:hypothetical protein